jgi:hypothetical protein
MALILDPTDETVCVSVRKLLGGVDNITLPDDDITDSAIFDVAELQIVDILPNYADFTDDPSKQRIRLAVIHMIASMLCPSMPSRVDVTVKAIDTSWQRKPVDYMSLGVQLEMTANQLLVPLGADGGKIEVDFIGIAQSARYYDDKWNP